ncbi:hypothetical protein D5R40_33545 [Okeania hirsuta]|uniref:Uncharacterized protein n=1 Tax=Okeania hirsuta TaxID=1458930 RepID=A0A3N6MMB7_9CYAN|nr:hypothetical protein D4Z78_31510 [Okeania hirsuta]RQH04859.1 hypothetical protein D4Z78_30995 [Okeania hirsuta]RQH17075.1 hypothetical protein D5R40_33545 [Okeania hirsuta]
MNFINLRKTISIQENRIVKAKKSQRIFQIYQVQILYHFDKCLLQMVGKLHARSVRKKDEGRRKKEEISKKKGKTIDINI